MRTSIHCVIRTVIVIGLAGCAAFELPSTPGEQASGFSYVPLDPLPVDDLCKTDKKKKVLDRLPDNAVRIAIAEVSASGDVSFSPAKVGIAGNNYQVILDYINVDPVGITYSIEGRDPDSKEYVPIRSADFIQQVRDEKIQIRFKRVKKDEKTTQFVVDDSLVSIPVYVGVGLRLTANVTVQEGTVELGGLGALAASAQAGRISGSLVVQTLGVTGEKVAASLPLPSQLDSSTIQNAILAIGSIKSILYADDDGVLTTPRVTGIHNPLPFGDAIFINAIVSDLSFNRVPWGENC